MTSTMSRTVHRHAAPEPRPAAPQLPRPPAPSPLTTRRTRLAGRWRYDRLGGTWEWSEEMAALHGLTDGSPGPCTEVLVAAQHPDDRPRTIDALSAAVTGAQAFCLEVRLTTGGRERPVVFLGEPQLDDDGAVTAVEGLVVEAPSAGSPTAEERVRALETEVAQLRTAMASRAPIEQAKGVLMLLTGCGDQVAFDLLAHISSHTHRKVREVALELVASASGQGPLPADVRSILRDACPPDRRVP
ncbi:ANTAR domain-containing protein [Geodermatophilus telluris]|uniref:ANTAR domain-containing protein n=1 Tax=Geodermatophilus telluris TaxID=1190417 RepID=A0A1G6LH91_9ACTN|nr:ANTAR domain-containing protein [Geodermatophilus telluris]SDC42601.1 ANTAR domain-containing protein [Geodermatophilus telluris]